MSDDADFELLTRWRAGDVRAGRDLVSSYYDEIRGCFANCVNPEDRRDLVQETWRRLLEHVDKFERRSSFRTYLYRIATNTRIDYYRKRARRRGDFDPLTHSVEDVQGVAASHVLTAVERHRQLLDCLRRLPIETMHMLELYYWHGFSGRELAALLEISEHALWNRLAAARKRLRECMEDPPTPDDDSPLEASLRELGRLFELGKVDRPTDPKIDQP